MLDFEYVGPQDPSHYCLVLHGLGDSMEGWKPMQPALDQPQIGFIYVNAPDAYFGGYSWFPYPGLNADPDDPECTRRGIKSSSESLAETIAHVKDEFNFTNEQLILMGFSQGCVMVLDYALRSEDLFCSVIGLSGACLLIDEFPDAFGSKAKEQNILLCHGRYDDVVPIHASRMHAGLLRQWGINIDWREYDVQHGVDQYEELPDLRQWLAGVTK